MLTEESLYVLPRRTGSWFNFQVHACGEGNLTPPSPLPPSCPHRFPTITSSSSSYTPSSEIAAWLLSLKMVAEEGEAAAGPGRETMRAVGMGQGLYILLKQNEGPSEKCLALCFDKMACMNWATNQLVHEVVDFCCCCFHYSSQDSGFLRASCKKNHL